MFSTFHPSHLRRWFLMDPGSFFPYPDFRTISRWLASGGAKLGADHPLLLRDVFFFTLSDFENFDYIYVMDKSNYQNVIALSNNEKHRSKVKLILTEKYEDEIKEVPDPYFGMENGFDIVYEMLDSTCDIIATKLKSKHS
jgi:hypothetical protein